MCNLSQLVKAEAWAAGLEEGRATGLEEGRAEGMSIERLTTAVNLHNMGMDDSFIARALNITVDAVRQLLSPQTV